MVKATPCRVYVVFGITIDLRCLKEPSVVYVCVFLSLMSHPLATTLVSNDRGLTKFVCAHLIMVIILGIWYSARVITGSGIRYLSACLVMVLSQLVSLYWPDTWYLSYPLSCLGSLLVIIEVLFERSQFGAAEVSGQRHQGDELKPPSS